MRPADGPAPKEFALVDEAGHTARVDLADFYVVNDFEPETVNAIGRMQPGDEMSFGGGAAPLFILRRLS